MCHTAADADADEEKEEGGRQSSTLANTETKEITRIARRKHHRQTWQCCSWLSVAAG
jgi:hypothetical protein